MHPPLGTELKLILGLILPKHPCTEHRSKSLGAPCVENADNCELVGETKMALIRVLPTLRKSSCRAVREDAIA